MHVLYTVERDEDGVWCAHSWLGRSGGANGNGATPEDAVADLREAVQMVVEVDDATDDINAVRAAMDRLPQLLDREAWEERARADMQRLSSEDLTAEPNAWEYDVNGNILIVGTDLTIQARLREQEDR